ncbi:MAG TPA: hypothetical protein PKJ51_06355 [Methanothrix sp.]|nr:hypothetical protein [Methanothrix sp.]
MCVNRGGGGGYTEISDGVGIKDLGKGNVEVKLDIPGQSGMFMSQAPPNKQNWWIRNWTQDKFVTDPMTVSRPGNLDLIKKVHGSGPLQGTFTARKGDRITVGTGGSRRYKGFTKTFTVP